MQWHIPDHKRNTNRRVDPSCSLHPVAQKFVHTNRIHYVMDSAASDTRTIYCCALWKLIASCNFQPKSQSIMLVCKFKTAFIIHLSDYCAMFPEEIFKAFCICTFSTYIAVIAFVDTRVMPIPVMPGLVGYLSTEVVCFWNCGTVCHKKCRFAPSIALRLIQPIIGFPLLEWWL